MEIYVVRPGDSVDSIARALDANVELLIYDNQLVYPYELAVGQALLVNGYAGEADRAAAVMPIPSSAPGCWNRRCPS